MPRLLTLIVLVLAAALPAAAQPQPVDQCRVCHLQLDDERLTPPARQFPDDAHAQQGLTCASCHGGDATVADVDAMDPAKGFVGVPTPQQVPQLCAKCHADATFMHRYNPSIRVDQLAQYRTSVHGQLLFQKNDTHVATCTSCHTVHAIRGPTDPRSSVYPLNVPKTCATCHADKTYMAPYGIPTDQFAEYQKSVHWNAVSKGGDLSAPVCNDCHGSHGAVPPGASSVANACGQCHDVPAGYFDKSVHAKAFESAGLLGCATCHGHHDIEAASDGMLGTPQQAVCSQCHAADEPAGRTADALHEEIARLARAYQAASSVLDRAEHAGMEVSDARFTLTTARGDLVKARAAQHAADLAAVRPPVDEGLAITRQAEAAGRQALAELAYRRRGFAVALVVILAVIAGLALTVHRIEREPGGGPRPMPPGGH